MANCAVFVRLVPTGVGLWNYQKWDPVHVVAINGNPVPGEQERLPHGFWLVLFGASRLKVERYIREEHDTVDGLPDGDPTTARTRRRLFFCGSDSMPAGVMTIINNGTANHPKGQLWIGGGAQHDFTWAQLRQYIRNKLTNVTEEQAGTTIEDLA
ncbi:MAG TPA: hypothetical protein VJP77_05620 [Planctomycetota bacterium]|nr:hypothetical protein [Planctomycetota bacterium]